MRTAYFSFRHLRYKLKALNDKGHSESQHGGFRYCRNGCTLITSFDASAPPTGRNHHMGGFYSDTYLQ